MILNLYCKRSHLYEGRYQYQYDSWLFDKILLGLLGKFDDLTRQ